MSMSDTAAQAAIGAAARELHLPTVRDEAMRLVEIALRERHTLPGRPRRSTRKRNRRTWCPPPHPPPHRTRWSLGLKLSMWSAVGGGLPPSRPKSPPTRLPDRGTTSPPVAYHGADGARSGTVTLSPKPVPFRARNQRHSAPGFHANRGGEARSHREMTASPTADSRDETTRHTLCTVCY
jgi:hypothetical protein